MLKLKLRYLGHLMQRSNSFEKTLMLGKIEGGQEKGTTGDEMVGWHHQLNGHEFEQTPGDTKDRRGRCAALHEVAKSQNDLQLNN